MKKILFTLLIVFVLTGCNSITVMSYNIHAMRGMDKVVDVDRIAKVINEQDPDVVGLQEVDQFTERSGKIDAIKILEDKTGMNGVFMRTFDYQGGEFGNAMLSKYPIIDQKMYRLPSRDNYEARLMMMITCIIENGDTVHFYNTHLDHHRQDSDRPIQVEAIKKIIENDKSKIIFTGDFNCQPGTKSLSTIESVLTRCPSDILTYSTEEPIWTIDHIFYSEDRGIRFKELKVIPEEMASDHFPLVAKFCVK